MCDQTRGNSSFNPSRTASKIRESSSSLVVSIFRVRGPWRSGEGGKGPKGSQCYFIEQRVWLLELPMTRETPRDDHKPIYLLLRYFSQTRASDLPLANRGRGGEVGLGSRFTK